MVDHLLGCPLCPNDVKSSFKRGLRNTSDTKRKEKRHGWFTIGESISESNAEYKEAVNEKFDARWAYAHSDFLAAAYVLDPEFQEHEQTKNTEVFEGFLDVVDRIGILQEVRKSMEQYTEMWQKRKEAIAADPKKQATLEHYPTYPNAKSASVKAFSVKVNSQLACYRGKKGVFGRDAVMEAAVNMPAYMWWDQYGAATPELQTVACLVLSQPASASIVERINSEFGFVKDRRRNRLAHEKANKLVALFHNLRLMARMKKPHYSEPAVGWVTDENKTGITKWGITNYD
ncbi:hypothetical protein AB1Y20_007338 [Prymnesium parvum]|uniref:HAT C-terminal dimerisation domain-containing protein n=1 Tax=Prymnesium parvum TaxID=97485 RepID=A0AB34IVT6_PRYPA